MFKQLDTPTDADLQHVFGDHFDQLWTQSKVTAWLNENGWHCIAPVFEDHGICGRQFFQITLAELVNILPRRIVTYAQRRRLLNDIRALGLSSPTTHPSPFASPGDIYINTDLHLFPSTLSSSVNASPCLPSADCATPSSSHVPSSHSPTTPSSAASKLPPSLKDHSLYCSSPTSSTSLSPSPSSSDFPSQFRPLSHHQHQHQHHSRQSPTKHYSPKAAFAKFRNAILHRHDSTAREQHPPIATHHAHASLCTPSPPPSSYYPHQHPWATTTPSTSHTDTTDDAPSPPFNSKTASTPEKIAKLWSSRHTNSSAPALDLAAARKANRIQITGDRDTWYSLNVEDIHHADHVKDLIVRRMALHGHRDDYLYFHENGPNPDTPLDNDSILYLCSIADKSASHRILIVPKSPNTLYSYNHGEAMYHHTSHALSTPELGQSPTDLSSFSSQETGASKSKWNRLLQRPPTQKGKSAVAAQWRPVVGIQLSDPPAAMKHHDDSQTTGCWAVPPKHMQPHTLLPQSSPLSDAIHPLCITPGHKNDASGAMQHQALPISPLSAVDATAPSSTSSDYWGERPPTEIVLQNMDKYFDDHDLDKEVVVTTTPAPANGPLHLSTASSSSSTSTAPAAAKIQPPRKGLRRHVKSIRVVAREASKKYLLRHAPPGNDPETGFNGPNGSNGSNANAKNMQTAMLTIPNKPMLRRKSTKLWDQRVVEVKPEARRQPAGGATRRAHEAPMYLHLHSPTSSASSPATATTTSSPSSSSSNPYLPDDEPSVQWIRGKLIGKGSFGRVYLAFNVVSGEMIAVKQVDIPTAGCRDVRQHDMVDALYREIDMLRDLDHEHIVQYLGYGVDEQEAVVNIFLEYVSGGNVATRLALHGGFDERLVRHFTRQICQGLAYLHDRQILHRDIKAANILVEADGACKISDFGLSKKNDYDEAYDQNSRMSLRGSVYWMAPEVVKNEPYSAKVDIWSLGCTVLEMFTGQRPWIALNQIAALYNLGHCNAPEIPDFISPVGQDFISKCFNTDPCLRPTALELLAHPFCAPDPTFCFKEYIDNNKV
ncbi:hypothetical protein BC940DRAFT_330616 [Gongronella butleri]|nr:hypothetical protein BC940DRAFT_330616 [Gongronella butleri]